MATTKFRLRGKNSIYIRFSAGRGKSFERKTNLTIDPTRWSESTGMPKTRNATVEDKNITTTLNKLSTFILERYNKAIQEGDDLTTKWLQHQLDVFFGVIDEIGVSNKVTDHIKEIIRTAHTRPNSRGGVGISKSRIRKYKLLERLFTEFQGNNNYKIKDLSRIKFDKFREWLFDKKNYAPSMVNKTVKDLKGVCYDAESKGIEVSRTLRAVKVRQLKTYDKDTDVVTLSFEEIEKIENLLLTSDALINARKWLILACYTGQRGGDLMKLKKEDFKKKRGRLIIEIVQEKVNKIIEIPVHPKVEKIYRNGLPYSLAMQNLNNHLKELGQLAEIDKLTMGLKRERYKGRFQSVKRLRPKWQYLGTHVGRRSFATNYYSKGMPVWQIMAITGHTKEETFFKYINKKQHSHLDGFFKCYDNETIKMEVLKGGKQTATN